MVFQMHSTSEPSHCAFPDVYYHLVISEVSELLMLTLDSSSSTAAGENGAGEWGRGQEEIPLYCAAARLYFLFCISVFSILPVSLFDFADFCCLSLGFCCCEKDTVTKSNLRWKGLTYPDQSITEGSQGRNSNRAGT